MIIFCDFVFSAKIYHYQKLFSRKNYTKEVFLSFVSHQHTKKFYSRKNKGGVRAKANRSSKHRLHFLTAKKLFWYTKKWVMTFFCCQQCVILTSGCKDFQCSFKHHTNGKTILYPGLKDGSKSKYISKTHRTYKKNISISNLLWLG